MRRAFAVFSSFIGSISIRDTVLLLASVGAALCAGYSAWTAYRSLSVYRLVTTTGHGWEAPLNAYDAELGYVRIPGRQGQEDYPGGYRVDVCQSRNGFRIPCGVPDEEDGARPRILALGCSMTFGTGCKAEEAFPYLVAKGLGGSVLNAGVGGYGLAQMQLRARRLISVCQPDWVLVQYSPWLISRSIDPIRTIAGKHSIAVPYFATSADGSISIAPPQFSTNYFDLPVWAYAGHASSTGDFVEFLVRVGFPLWLNFDLHHSAFEVKQMAGLCPKPARDSPELVKQVYGEISELCRRNGAKMVIVIVGSGMERSLVGHDDRIPALEGVAGAIVVDANAALLRHLEKQNSEEYLKAYGIWSGDPPQLVDLHPNARAHAIIAAEVLKRLRPDGT